MPFCLTVVVLQVLCRMIGPGSIDHRFDPLCLQVVQVREELIQVVALVVKVFRFRVGREGDVRDEDRFPEKRFGVLGSGQRLRVDVVVRGEAVPGGTAHRLDPDVVAGTGRGGPGAPVVPVPVAQPEHHLGAVVLPLDVVCHVPELVVEGLVGVHVAFVELGLHDDDDFLAPHVLVEVGNEFVGEFLPAGLVLPRVVETGPTAVFHAVRGDVVSPVVEVDHRGDPFLAHVGHAVAGPAPAAREGPGTDPHDTVVRFHAGVLLGLDRLGVHPESHLFAVCCGRVRPQDPGSCGQEAQGQYTYQ